MHSHNNNSEGCNSTTRKKQKLESKTLLISAAADASKGPRDSMEDTHTIRDDLKFYGVYDGHGGEEAAAILQQMLHTNIVESELYGSGKIEEAINQAFLAVDNHILQESQAKKLDCGTTAVVALVQGTKLYVANCGDSEAVLGRRKLQRKGSKLRSRRNTESASSTPVIPDESPAVLRSLTVTLPLDSSSNSLTDSLGVSPTSVLSHLSLASPNTPGPRFIKSNGGPFDSANQIKSTTDPLATSASPNLSLTQNHTNHNGTQNGKPHLSNGQFTNNTSSQPVDNAQTNNSSTDVINPPTPTIIEHVTQITQVTQVTQTTDPSSNVHKRTHSPKMEGDHENGVEGDEDDEEWEEWEEDPGDTLTADIEAYLKENPNSFFCHKEGQCGIFEPVVVSRCHRPTCEDEIKRIDAAGGSVSYGRVQGELGVTRAFGDINYKHPHNKGKADFVSVLPHIKVIDLQPHDEFLILASDGLWDVVSHKEAVDVISKSRSSQEPHQACEDLVDEALRKNSFDNVTVLVLSFQWK